MLLNEKGRWTEMLVQNENPWLPLCSEPMCSLSMAPVFPAQPGCGWGLMEMSKSVAVTLVRICWAGNNAGKDKRCLGTSELFHILCWAGLWCGSTPLGKQHQCPTPTFHHTTASHRHWRSPGLRQAALLGRSQWQQSLNSCWYQPSEQFQKCVPAGRVSPPFKHGAISH